MSFLPMEFQVWPACGHSPPPPGDDGLAHGDHGGRGDGEFLGRAKRSGLGHGEVLVKNAGTNRKHIGNYRKHVGNYRKI